MSIRKGSSIIAGNIGQNVDSALSPTSDNPVKNSVIYDALRNTLSTDSITNCITEIPQDIKLELNSGTLTLKAGSKLYYPNGFESDNTTLHFDTFTTTSDLVIGSGLSYINTEHIVFINNDGTSASCARNISDAWSGDAAPTSGVATLASGVFWYDTINNIIRKTTDGGTTWSNVPSSFPICVFKTNANREISEIINIFNGFGYLATTVFVLPGVTGLFPDGRNEDGSLKNIKVTSDNVLIKNYTNPSDKEEVFYYVLRLSNVSNNWVLNLIEPTTNDYKYDEKENIWYYYSYKMHYCVFAKVQQNTNTVGTQSNGKIKYFSTKKTYQALNSNDSESIAHQAMPSNKYITFTNGASGTGYNAPADGYLYIQTTASTNEQGWVSINIGGNYQPGLDITREGIGKIFIPISKNQSGTVTYGGTSLATIRFIYANGSI